MACNYNAEATDAGDCHFANGCESCSGETDGTGTIVNNDSDGDGICDFNEIIGCTDALACNYNAEATDSDNSCIYSELGYDCDGNIDISIGDNAFGGIVFYIDPTGEHGLVAYPEDFMQEGCNCDNPNGYEWGCYGIEVVGADGQELGSGYQNTLDIVNQECQAQDGISAAEAISSINYEGYDDWYLPSLNELEEMYYSIGGGGNLGNLGNFVQNPSYYSSSERDDNRAWAFHFGSGVIDSSHKRYDLRVRPIRSF